MFARSPISRRRTACALLVCSLAALAGCNFGWQQARFKETRQLTVDHQPGTALDVETRNGAIDVRVVEADSVEIDAHIRAITQERLDLTKVVASRLDDGTLYLRVQWPEGGRKNSEGCGFDIRLPDASGATLKSSNGALTLVGASGLATLATSNGRITVENHQGDVHVDTSNGRVQLANINGSVDAETSNGAVRVELADGAGGPIRIDTSNGSVHLGVGGGFAGELTARTSNGSVSVVGFTPGEIAEKRRRSCRLVAEAVVDPSSQGGESRIRSSNGSISITRRAG